MAVAGGQGSAATGVHVLQTKQRQTAQKVMQRKMITQELPAVLWGILALSLLVR